MPTIEWIGKEKVVNYHQQVPFKALNWQYSYDKCGLNDKENNSENMVIHGDNLEALKSLLPRFENRVKCIYIDPPYNTGNENWVYNDNVNDSKIKKWLGEVVGKEGDDLSRHDKWLCMMYPRLRLLQKLLADNGTIFISIDDNEIVYLRAVMDEIFGISNFIAQITLMCNPKGRNQDKYFATCHEYLLVYSKTTPPAGFYSIKKEDTRIQKEYKLIDERGNYRLIELRNTHKEFGKKNRPNLWYPLYVSEKDGSVSLVQDNLHKLKVYPTWQDGYEGCWTWGRDKSQEEIISLIAQKRKGEWKIFRKSYAVTSDGTAKQKLFTIWNDPQFYTEKGQAIFGKLFPGTNKNDFPQPKSVEYITNIIRCCTEDNDIVLDSFAGSGTTAHSVLNLNKADGTKRRFILIEMEDYAKTITAERVKRVISGYGEGESFFEGSGGSFSFYNLGDPLIINENINCKIEIEKIREYFWFMETRIPYTNPHAENKYYLGINNDTAYYLFYHPEKTSVLDYNFLATIKEKANSYIIFADRCDLSKDRLDAFNIVFKKIPRDINKL